MILRPTIVKLDLGSQLRRERGDVPDIARGLGSLQHFDDRLNSFNLFEHPDSGRSVDQKT